MFVLLLSVPDEMMLPMMVTIYYDSAVYTLKLYVIAL